MAGAQPRTPCRSIFKQLEILPVPWQYILSLMNFIVNNTRNKHCLCRPNASLSCFQNSTFYAGI